MSTTVSIMGRATGFGGLAVIVFPFLVLFELHDNPLL